MKEQLEIFKFSNIKTSLTIHTTSEFYGACRHTHKFHRYLTNYTPSSTDDKHTSSERVGSQISSSSSISLYTENNTQNIINLCTGPHTTPELF